MFGQRLFVVAVSLVLTLQVSAAPEMSQKALVQIQTLMAEKASRSVVENKVSSALLLEHKRRTGDLHMAALPDLQLGSGVQDNGMVLVDIDGQITDRLLQRAEALDGTVVNAFPQFEATRMELPLAEVLELAALPEVRSIRPADGYMLQVTTEGDVAHGTDTVRTNFGVDGTGVQVGSMSDSVEALTDLINSGELPAGTTVLPDQAGTGTSEGTALMEIVHDMAPGADLFFATGQGGQAQMAQNILDLQAAGCDVIVDDVLYFAEPVFQDGVIAEAVNAVAAVNTIYFSSAGNSGRLSAGTSGVHEGTFSGIALPTVLTGAGMSAHDFGSGSNNTNLDVDTPFFITLQWANPQDAATDDYDLFLLNPAMDTVIAASTNTQDGTQDPFEFIDSLADDHTDHKIVVTKFAGDDVFIHMNTHRGQIEHGTNGQIFGHPAAEGAIAVAAVNVATANGGVFTGGAANPLETFSSDGPRRIFFEADGTPVSATSSPNKGGQTSIVRQKPDVAAADGVSTATPGFNPFFGTSASAPHGAGMSALFEELFPSVQTKDALDLFFSSALDIEDPGLDDDSGHGIMMLEDPMNNVIFSDGFESGDATSWTSN